jgi:hypothetical protein
VEPSCIRLISLAEVPCLPHDGFRMLEWLCLVSTSCLQIFGVGTGKARLCKINLKEEHDEFLDWSRPSGE